MTQQLVELPSGVSLEVDLTRPISITEPRKLAVCLHPWSWLGGQKDDPVLLSLVSTLRNAGYHVLRYNSRGVGGSTGWPSFTGLKEVRDLEDLVTWAVRDISAVESIVIMGYSHGSLIASLHPIVPNIKTSHILISYPLGPRSWLTLFHSRTYGMKLKDLVQNSDSNVLILYGDRDEFTGISSYREWRQELGTYSDERRLKIVEIAQGTHFWGGRFGEVLSAEVERWLP